VHEGLYENPRPSQKNTENRRSLNSLRSLGMTRTGHPSRAAWGCRSPGPFRRNTIVCGFPHGSF